MSYTPNDDLDLGELDEVVADEYGNILSGIGNALGKVAGFAAPLANFIPGVGPLVSAGLGAASGALGKHAAPSAGEAVQAAIQAATGAAPAGLASAVQAAIPGAQAALAAGVDPATLVAALPDVVKSAVREAVAEHRAGQLSQAAVTETVAKSVGADLLPHLATVVAAVNQAKLQQQATQEHRDLNARAAFKAEVRSKLDQLLAGQRAMDPRTAFLRRSI